jgi:hypothetical protein
VARYAAFGRMRTWTIVDLTSSKSQWLPLPPEMMPRELVVSNDGRLVVFTGYSREAGTYLLYSWDKNPAHAPQRIGDSRGYHANPAFDPTDEWVYFAHNPNALARMNPGANTKAVTDLVGDAMELTVSLDGKAIVYAVKAKHGQIVMMKLNVDRVTSSAIGSGFARWMAEPRFGTDGSVFYVIEDAVWRVRAGSKSRIALLAGGPG